MHAAIPSTLHASACMLAPQSKLGNTRSILVV